MDFANIEGVTTAASLVEKNNPKEADLDRQAFLKLFTTQLQNQNPLEPVKNEAFIAQLAQFSTLEATSSMSDSLSNFVADQRARGLMEGASPSVKVYGYNVPAQVGQWMELFKSLARLKRSSFQSRTRRQAP